MALGGLSYSTQVTAEQRAQLVTLCGDAVREAWHCFAWWELERIEERFYKAAWNSGTTYGAGDIVRAADADGDIVYWESLQAGNLNKTPATETAWWEETESFDAYLLLAATGETEMGAVTEVWDGDPRVTRPCRVPYGLRNGRIQFAPGDAPIPSVHVVFQLAAPMLDGAAWDPEQAYADGDVVYYHGDGVTAGHGECYRASGTIAGSPSNDAPPDDDSWKVIQLPHSLAGIIIHETRAHALRADGQEEKAMAAMRDRDRAYDAALMRNTVTQQQNGRYARRTR